MYKSLPSSLSYKWFYLPTPILHTREGGGPKILKFWSEIAPCGQTPVYDPSPAPPLSPVFWGVGKGPLILTIYTKQEKHLDRNSKKQDRSNTRIKLKHTKFCVRLVVLPPNPHSTY